MTRSLRVVLAFALAALAVACNDAPPKQQPESNPDVLRNMAPRDPGVEAALAAGATPEAEPNDVLEQATRLESAARAVRATGTLTSGAADTDVFWLPPASDAGAAPRTLAVTLTPLGNGGDLLLGIVARNDTAPVWFDAALAGDAEWIPNVALGRDGTWIAVTGRGAAELAYQLDVETLPDQAATEAEPNDTDRLAHPLAVGATTTAYVNRAGDRDVFRIPPADATAGAMTVSVSPPGAGRVLDVTLRDDKQTIWRTTVRDGEPATFPGLRPSNAGYTLVVELVGEVDKPRLYTVALEQPQTTAAVELEPNDDPASAQDLAPGLGPLRASIGQAGDLDHFRVVFPPPADPAAPPQILSVQIEPADAALDPRLDVKLVEAGLAFPIAGGRGGEVEALCNLAVSGQNTVEILVAAATEPPPEATLPLDYTLAVTLRAADGEEIEPNDRREAANELALATPIAGFVHPATDRDVYAFTVPPVAADPAARATTTLKVAEGYKANLALELYDAQFAAVTTGDRTGFGEAETLVAPLPAGQYFVVVRSHGLASCSKPYRLSVGLDAAYLQRATGTAAVPDQGTTAPIGTDPGAPTADTPDTIGGGAVPDATGPTSPTTPVEPTDDGEPPPDRIEDDGMGF